MEVAALVLAYDEVSSIFGQKSNEIQSDNVDDQGQTSCDCNTLYSNRNLLRLSLAVNTFQDIRQEFRVEGPLTFCFLGTTAV